MQARASKPRDFARMLVREGRHYRREWPHPSRSRWRPARRNDELSHDEIMAMHREMGAALGKLLEAET
jgi:hypothetical protein